MKTNFILLLLFLGFGLNLPVLAEEHNHDHGHKHEQKSEHDHDEEEEGHDHGHEKKSKHDHDEEEDHDHGHKKKVKHDHDEKASHEDEHGHGHASKLSKDKAVMEVNDDGGVKLSKEAIALLEIKTRKAINGEFSLPLDAIVFIKRTKGFYLKRDDFFYFIENNNIKKSQKEFSVNYSKFQKNDEIVIAGVELLRISDVFAKDESEYGHGH